MRPTRLILVGIIVHQLFVSCDNGEKHSLVTGAAAGNMSLPVSEAAPQSVQQITAGSGTGNVQLNPKHGEPGHRCEIAVGAPLNSTPSQVPNLQPGSVNPSAAAAQSSNSLLSLPNLPAPGASPSGGGNGALNPKHGEPGHRCDIAVGAPLISTPSTAPGTVSAPAPSPAAVVPAFNQGAAGNGKLNPKHGEPGHRCDIAVGAPLSSIPNTVSQPVTSSASPSSSTPIGAAALPALQLPNTGSNANSKTNPKHGEPGHRCDIAVGAKLN